MKILGLEGYYGGSHKAFIDGWVCNSRHEWTLLTLPANKWKWRMRHGAVTFAEKVNELAADGQKWDVLFCSDMLNLAEFIGLIDERVRQIKAVVYFHENQLTYPVRVESERDYQFAVTNMTTALAADAVWFNSAFHRDEFLDALGKFLKRMPDNQPTGVIEKIRRKSAVYPPGIESFERRKARTPGPVRILWAARWEHDKGAEDFFAAVKILKESGIEFRLSVIGQQFRDVPEVFDRAKDYFAEFIEHWGYQESIDNYRAVLSEADIIASAAKHEFFGISVAEAIAAGAYPVLPKRLSYPEIVRGIERLAEDEFFYDGTVEGLADKLKSLIAKVEASHDLWAGRVGTGQLAMRLYTWDKRAAVMDNDLEDIVSGSGWTR
jgi:glycosyltransferase involved in cell wall biosynthesis